MNISAAQVQQASLPPSQLLRCKRNGDCKLALTTCSNKQYFKMHMQRNTAASKLPSPRTHGSVVQQIRHISLSNHATYRTTRNQTESAAAPRPPAAAYRCRAAAGRAGAAQAGAAQAGVPLLSVPLAVPQAGALPAAALAPAGSPSAASKAAAAAGRRAQATA